MIDTSYYGTVDEGDQFFAARLHADVWIDADSGAKAKALFAARCLIDGLDFVGRKTSESQILEFPRGGEAEVPEQVRKAAYLIAAELLDGKIPELELESLAISSETTATIKTMYDRSCGPIEHVINMIPSPEAWALLRPLLRGGNKVRLVRS